MSATFFIIIIDNMRQYFLSNLIGVWVLSIELSGGYFSIEDRGDSIFTHILISYSFLDIYQNILFYYVIKNNKIVFSQIHTIFVLMIVPVIFERIKESPLPESNQRQLDINTSTVKCSTD